jgi:uncharacterized membrane protein YbaN (DUF454 family)
MQHSPENVHSALVGRRPGEIAGLLAGLAGVVIFGPTLPMTQFALAAAALLLGEQAGWHHAVFALAFIGVVIVGRQYRVEKAKQQ